jgi:hypothetical protein
MLTFVVRRRDTEAPPDWLADVDVAARRGINRATVWKWLDVPAAAASQEGNA